MRKMPYGQWVAFENDDPHDCKREPVKVKPKPAPTVPGFDDFDLPGGPNPEPQAKPVGSAAKPSPPKPLEFDDFKLPPSGTGATVTRPSGTTAQPPAPGTATRVPTQSISKPPHAVPPPPAASLTKARASVSHGRES
jgi:hypothetical protein